MNRTFFPRDRDLVVHPSLRRRWAATAGFPRKELVGTAPGALTLCAAQGSAPEPEVSPDAMHTIGRRMEYPCHTARVEGHHFGTVCVKRGVEGGKVPYTRQRGSKRRTQKPVCSQSNFCCRSDTYKKATRLNTMVERHCPCVIRNFFFSFRLAWY